MFRNHETYKKVKANNHSKVKSGKPNNAAGLRSEQFSKQVRDIFSFSQEFKKKTFRERKMCIGDKQILENRHLAKSVNVCLIGNASIFTDITDSHYAKTKNKKKEKEEERK